LFSRLNYGSLALRPAALLALLVGADRVRTQPTRTFTSGLPMVWSPAPSPDITTAPTGKLALAGLSPARSSTSFTALTGQCLPILRCVKYCALQCRPLLYFTNTTKRATTGIPASRRRLLQRTMDSRYQSRQGGRTHRLRGPSRLQRLPICTQTRSGVTLRLKPRNPAEE
jgi:hypothetical protein